MFVIIIILYFNQICVFFAFRFLQLFVDKFKTTDGIENLLDYGQVRLPKLEHVLARTIEEKKLTFKLDLVLVR